MERKSDGKFSFNEVYAYLANGTYPNGLSKMKKSVLRRRVKFFRISGHELYYVGGGKSLATSFHS